MSTRNDKMTEDHKRELAQRGQMSRPVGWTRTDRRRVLRARRASK